MTTATTTATELAAYLPPCAPMLMRHEGQRLTLTGDLALGLPGVVALDVRISGERIDAPLKLQLREGCADDLEAHIRSRQGAQITADMRGVVRIYRDGLGLEDVDLVFVRQSTPRGVVSATPPAIGPKPAPAPASMACRACARPADELDAAGHCGEDIDGCIERIGELHAERKAAREAMSMAEFADQYWAAIQGIPAPAHRLTEEALARQTDPIANTPPGLTQAYGAYL